MCASPLVAITLGLKNATYSSPAPITNTRKGNPHWLADRPTPWYSLQVSTNAEASLVGFTGGFLKSKSFNESIKSRFRDEFTYASFSEGEKMRIDLALLFTWRQIAKLKNSTNTNLLILDEVFDSSLDGVGTEEFLKLIHEMGNDTNIFVISHKGDQLFDKFRSIIKFEKKNNFSQVAK